MTDTNNRQPVPKIGRRRVLTNLAGTLGAALALSTRGNTAAAASASAAPEAVPQAAVNAGQAMSADLMMRMQGDLQRALAKPPKDRRWVMVIDLRKCVGCSSCTIACIAENKLPPGVVYRPVLEEQIGTYPNVTRKFVPRPCMQCDNPACTAVCPVNATYKNEDGIVAIDYDQCIGCRYCMTACPYGARTFDMNHTYTEGTPQGGAGILGQTGAQGYERAATYEYSKTWERKGDASPIGNARKCHFCMHRVKAGMLPDCVSTCIGRATLFGDANDPGSLVAEMIAKPNVMRLKEEMGTQPRVYYLA